MYVRELVRVKMKIKLSDSSKVLAPELAHIRLKIKLKQDKEKEDKNSISKVVPSKQTPQIFNQTTQ